MADEKDNNLVSLVYAADKYELPGLMMICQEKMKKNLNQDNVLETLLAADRHGLVEVKKRAMENIARNKKTYMQSEVFKTDQRMSPRASYGDVSNLKTENKNSLHMPYAG